MGTILLTAVLAALLSSAGTVFWVSLLMRRRQEELSNLLEARVKAGILAGIAEADFDEPLAEVEERVRAGVSAAMTDAEVREMLAGWADEIEVRVREGTTEAISSLAHPDRIRDATLNVTEAGTQFIAEGLNSLLGGTKKEPDDRT